MPTLSDHDRSQPASSSPSDPADRARQSLLSLMLEGIHHGISRRRLYRDAIREQLQRTHHDLLSPQDQRRIAAHLLGDPHTLSLFDNLYDHALLAVDQA